MHTRANRIALGLLLGFLALNAFGGGYYGLVGAEGVPIQWLEGSPFTSYFIPALILFVVVGGTAAVAAISVFLRHRRGFELARLAGWILVTWLLAQIGIIGFVWWMQPASAAAAIAILWLAYRQQRFVPAWRTLYQSPSWSSSASQIGPVRWNQANGDKSPRGVGMTTRRI